MNIPQNASANEKLPHSIVFPLEAEPINTTEEKT
jgi:hypothetical protein